jgi:hypothetical protein
MKTDILKRNLRSNDFDGNLRQVSLQRVKQESPLLERSDEWRWVYRV